MEKIKKVADTILGGICISIMSLTVVLVNYQVITRYFFNSPSSFSESLSQYLFVWMIMLGAAYVFGYREHMYIGVIPEMASPKGKALLSLFSECVTVIFALAVLVYGGYLGAASQMAQNEPSLPISMGFVYAVLPISGGFILFYFFYNCTKLISDLKNAADTNKGSL